MLKYYEDQYFYYFVKPHNIPSTYGKEYCFLDLLEDYSKKNKEINQIFGFLKEFWTKEEEYGLLNRLDNETMGLLYFAKNPLFKQKYLELQEQNLILKYYLADVYWEFYEDERTITYPIAHHAFDEKKMVAVKSATEKFRWKPNNVETQVKKIFYDTEKNITTLLVTIHKRIRHQIRCHLSSIGYPIVGEKIYIKKKSSENLCLWSLWLQTK